MGKAKPKKVQIVGPSLIVDGKDVIAHKTEFSVAKNIEVGDLQSVALELHTSFVLTVNEEINKPKEEVKEVIEINENTETYKEDVVDVKED